VYGLFEDGEIPPKHAGVKHCTVMYIGSANVGFINEKFTQ
jgi:hypothetical protein